MNTKILLAGSAIYMGILGIAGTFLPGELLLYLGAPSAGLTLLVFQIAGALYLGFAMLNWMLRETPVGGIYGRPLLMGNFIYFVVVAMTLGKFMSGETWETALIALLVISVIFAVGFASLLFFDPRAKKG